MKKFLKIALLVIILGGTVFILIAANQKVSEQHMEKPIIDLTVQDEIALLTENELLNELYVLRLFQDSMKKSDLKITEIEAYLEGMNEVLSAHVYMELDERWHIDVRTRRPIARVIANEIDDFYIDNDYKLMRLSPYARSEEHTSELQSRPHLVCRLLLEKKKKQYCCRLRRDLPSFRPRAAASSTALPLARAARAQSREHESLLLSLLAVHWRLSLQHATV